MADTQTKQAKVLELYETHYERIARYIFICLGDPQAAEDLAIETFLEALRLAGSFQGPEESMEQWILQIAYALVTEQTEIGVGQRGPSVANRMVSRRRGQQAGVPEGSSEESDPDVALAMSALTPEQRQICGLRFGGKVSTRQAASLVGKSLELVLQVQATAIRRLRDTWGRG